MSPDPLSGFLVEWVHQEPVGVAMSCLVCGVCHWKAGQTRLLSEMVAEAHAHRRICP